MFTRVSNFYIIYHLYVHKIFLKVFIYCKNINVEYYYYLNGIISYKCIIKRYFHIIENFFHKIFLLYTKFKA